MNVSVKTVKIFLQKTLDITVKTVNFLVKICKFSYKISKNFPAKVVRKNWQLFQKKFANYLKQIRRFLSENLTV